MLRLTSALVILFLLGSPLLLSTFAYAQTVEAVANVAEPSVGVILAKSSDGISSGTGFIAADRIVLTAYHVVQGATRVVIKFPDYPPVDARVVQSDRNNDLAVLSIPGLPLRPLPLGRSGQVHEGETIVVIGFPRVEVLGPETATVTEGIVSAIRPGLLQIQAPISPGNSGGPVLNLRAEVIGIVLGTLRGQQQGINFATSINAAEVLLGTAGFTPPGMLPTPPNLSPPTYEYCPACNDTERTLGTVARASSDKATFVVELDKGAHTVYMYAKTVCPEFEEGDLVSLRLEGRDAVMAKTTASCQLFIIEIR